MGVVINPKMDAILTTLGKIKDDIKGLGFAAQGSGDIVSFPDSIGGFNVNRITADLAPVQMGSGDPSPSNIRPIIGHTEVETTGAGKNVLTDKKYLNGNQIQFGFIGSPSTTSYTLTLPTGTYTFSFTATDGTSTNFYVKNVETNTFIAAGGIGSSYTFTMPTTAKVAIWVYKNTYTSTSVITTAQLEKGSTATAYEPFGTSVLTEIGINQWDEQWEVGSISATDGSNLAATDQIRSKNYIPVTPSASYYIASSETLVVHRYGASKNYLGNINRQNNILDVPSDTYYVRFRTSTAYGVTYKNDISVNFPARFTDYYPYTGIGQVYGGTLDVTSGKLTCTHWITTLNGMTWTKSGNEGLFICNNPQNWAYSFKLPPDITTMASMYCSQYKLASYAGRNTDKTIYTTWATAASKYVGVMDSAYASADAATFKTAMEGVQLVYELATPIVYQLEPQDVQTVLGQNNIYTDGGEVNVWYVAGLS